MTIEVHNKVSDFNSYRAARVKSLFNAENGCNFDLVIDNVDLSGDWNIGVVVGPSGSGKTSIGRQIFGSNKIYDYTQGWSPDKPIIDDIAVGGASTKLQAHLPMWGLAPFPPGSDRSEYYQTENSSVRGLQGLFARNQMKL